LRLRRRGRAEVFGFASGSPRERFSRELREYEGELKTLYVLPSRKGTGTGAGHTTCGRGGQAFRGPSRELYAPLGVREEPGGPRLLRVVRGVPVAEDGFELGGAWLSEVVYGWKDLDALLSRPAGG